MGSWSQGFLLLESLLMRRFSGPLPLLWIDAAVPVGIKAVDQCRLIRLPGPQNVAALSLEIQSVPAAAQAAELAQGVEAFMFEDQLLGIAVATSVTQNVGGVTVEGAAADKGAGQLRLAIPDFAVAGAGTGTCRIHQTGARYHR